MSEKIPFWEETYKDISAVTFSIEPNMSVMEFESLFEKQWKVLDVGCGEGQNALYLAKQGFVNINAFDLSENGIKKLRALADINNVELNSFVGDLTKYQFETKFDLIMSFGTLHFVEKEEWKAFINRAKENTNVGGIHIMQIFTDVVPASEDIAPFAIGLAKDEEIKELYNDWEIIQFKSCVFEDEHPGVPKHLHASNKIVVRKI